MNVIEVSNLRKTFRGAHRECLQGIDLSLAAGRCLGILGPNGAGKTTTLEILLGLRAATQGHVRVLGHDPRAHDLTSKRRTAAVLQDTRLYGKLSVLEAFDLFRSFFPASLTNDELLERLDLKPVARQPLETLSGGMRQRVALGTALVGKPDLIFLDEPTTGLDPRSRRIVWDLVRGLKGQGVAFVLTTHFMEEASTLCDELLFLHDGRVLRRGSPAEIVREASAAGLRASDGAQPTLDDVFLEISGRRLQDDCDEDRDFAERGAR